MRLSSLLFLFVLLFGMSFSIDAQEIESFLISKPDEQQILFEPAPINPEPVVVTRSNNLDETDITVTIGTGTTLGSYPIYDYWWNVASVSLYTAAEIGTGQGLITHLRWYCGNVASGWGARRVYIYLKHTTDTQCTAVDWPTYRNNATLVYDSGAENYTGPTTIGWNEWDINDFMYDGTSNLYVMMYSYRPAYSTSTTNWYYHTSTNNHWYRYADSGGIETGNGTVNSNRPNIQLEIITSPTYPPLPILVSPANNSTGVNNLTGSLIWRNQTVNTHSFDVYLSTNQTAVQSSSPAARVATGTTDTVYIYSNLTQGTWYYWKIAARNDSTNEIANSAIWRFRTFAPAMDGIRTIGGVNPDYPTISAAITALNAAGTNQGVTFLIRGGIYNEVPNTFTNMIFSGPNSRVYFKPADTNQVTINVTCTSAEPFAFRFLDADYITFDGSHPDAPGRNLISVNAQGTNGYYGFWFSNGADYNTVKNVNVTVGGNTSTFRPIYIYFTSGTNPSAPCVGDTVMNCQITGGYYSFYIYGSSSSNHTNLFIANNKIVNFAYYGLYLYYVGNSIFDGNEIYNTGATTGALYGIYHIASNNNNNQITRNWIHDLIPSSTGTVYGIYLSNGPNALVANNMINIDPNGGGTIYGMYLGTSQKKVFYNTVRIGGSAGNYSSHAIFYSGAATSDSLVNNILINERLGGTSTYYHNALSFGTGTTPVLYSNNNIFSNGNESATDNRFNIRYNSVNYNTLSDARNAGYSFDNESYTFSPTFIGIPNLHINPTAPTLVESAGRPVSVTNDFDNQVRSTTPDIGADEGNFATGNDLIRPIIQHTPLVSEAITTPRVAVANITDNVGVSTGVNAPRLYYRNATNPSWSFVNADSIVGSNYYFTIPGFPLNTNVLYYLAAQDDAGNVTTLPFGGSGANPPGTTPPNNTFGYFVRASLSGNLTIGGENPDFVSISAALAALRDIGVGTGGVTFLIRSGTYNEQADTISFTSDSTRPVVFRPEQGAEVIINKTSTSSTGAFVFRNARYITLDGSWPNDPNGRHVRINTSGSITSVILFSDSSGYNTVKNCVLNIGITTSSTYRVVQFANTGTSPNIPLPANRVINCELIGGYYSIYAYGSTAELITESSVENCDIRDFYYYGLYTGYNTYFKFHKNRLFHVTPSSSSTVYGIFTTTGFQFGQITSNHVNNIRGTASSTVYGIRIYDANNLVANNMVNVGAGTTGSVYGIYEAGSGTYARTSYVNNSVWIQGTTSSGNSFGFYFGSTSATGDTLWGNIFQNTRSGGTTSNYHVGIYINTPTTILFSNYNLLAPIPGNLTDNNYPARIGTTNINTLEELVNNPTWSPRDQLSFSELAPFVADTNLHINPLLSTVIENGALRYPTLNFDFDGDTRSGTTCDIGADEGNFMGPGFGSLVGTVRDSIPGTPPMPNVEVRAGIYSAITDINGNFVIPDIRTGVYDVQARVACYDTVTITGVVVDSAQTDTLNFYMTRPILAVNPSSVEMLVPPGLISSTTVTLQNTGNSPLNWRVRLQTLQTSTDTRWGPDGSGYEAIDNVENDFPSFDFFDITSIGTTIFTGQDDYGLAANFGNFTFEYYGTTYSGGFWICSNGFIQLGTTTGSNSLGNTTLPTTVATNMIMPCWDDLVTTAITYHDIASNIFYVQWNGYRYSTPSNTVSFQVQLHGSNNGIIFAYNSMTESALNPTIGIQGGSGANNNYIQCYYTATSGQNIPTNMDGYKIAFAQNGWSTWIIANPTSGTILPGQTNDLFVQVTVDSTHTIGQILNANIRIIFNGCPSPHVIPVQITVGIPSEVSDQNGLPVEYKLHQNYPNPFNPVTEIRFDLKEKGLTKLTVFDLLGRTVATLVNEELPAGYHSVRFDGTKFAAGVYFYRIESGKFQALKKMVLVK
ncbi:MAG: carboxypeptidase regulatory-like domain-containing protein [bacterium]|nr:carboxypeptidase regulatory-like domain-containing protein [bacterium]